MNMNENTETWIDACEEVGLEENAENATYMFLCRYQIAGQNNDIKMDNIHFENVASFKYFETTVTEQNLFQNEIKRRLISDNAVIFHQRYGEDWHGPCTRIVVM
jgi:hypothetical protein